MNPLKRGEHVKVRLRNGEVAEAIYVTESPFYKKQHIVDINGSWFWAGSKIECKTSCRFVGPSCDLEWSKAK